MIRMAWEYLRGRKLRTALTTLAIVFGVAIIFAMNLVMPSVLEAFGRSMESETGADVSITSKTRESFQPTTILERVAEVDGVEAVTGVLQRNLLLPQDMELWNADEIEVIGVDPATVQAVRGYEVVAGRFIEPSETGVAVVPLGVAEIGDQVGVLTAVGLREFTVIGLLKDGNPDQPQVIMQLSDAQMAFNQASLINRVDVRFEAGARYEAVTNRLEKALGDGYLVDSDQAAGVASQQVGYMIFNLFGMLALFIGAFLIFNTFRTIIVERRHDLGMLRAIGATRRQLTQMILVESLMQGMVGVVFGLGLGYMLAIGMISGVNEMRAEIAAAGDIEIRFRIGALLPPVLLGLVTTLVASYIPSRRAGRVSPLEALRPTSVGDVKKAARWGLYVGVGMMGMAVVMLMGGERTAPLGAVLFLIGAVIGSPALVVPMAGLLNPLLTLWFRREGELARGNLTRQPGRASITASTLMIGLATLILVVGVVAGFTRLLEDLIDSSFASDVMVLPPTVAIYTEVLGADGGLGEQLRGLPEVEAVGELRYASSVYEDQRLEVFGINGEEYRQVAPFVFVEGDKDAAYVALDEGRNAIVNALAAATMGLEMGDEFVLTTAAGEQTYRVVGIANDILHFKLNGIFISHENMTADFYKTDSVMLMVNLKAGTSVDEAIESMKPIVGAYPQFRLEASATYRRELEETSLSTMSLFYGIAVLILIPAALGLLNTLTINVMERTREIGVVRAMGGTRRQVKRMVVAEALLLGLFGVSIGILVGVAMSYGFTLAFQAVGWQVPYIFPFLGIGAAVVLAVVLALTASVLPARNAAKLDIIRALQYE